MKKRKCEDTTPHHKHIWYAPNPDPKSKGQIQYECPGVEAE